jgi:hypothetical protein
MRTLNSTLDKKVLQSDGLYLDTQGLKPFEQYMQSYAARLEAYQQLRDHSPNLVTYSLKRLGQTYPDLLQKHGQRCQYDMTELLRYLALSILRDDEVFFKEQILSWLDTILLSHKKNSQCAIAYRYLQEAINNDLPFSSSLVRPYLDSVILILQSHV